MTDKNYDDFIECTLNIPNHYSYSDFRNEILRAFRTKGRKFDICDVYEDLDEMMIMHVNEHIADYAYIIRKLFAYLKVTMFGEDFGLSHVSYLLGLSTYHHSQLKTNISYSRLIPSEFNLVIDRDKIAAFEEAVRSFEKKDGGKSVRLRVHLADKNLFRLLTDNSPDYSELPFPTIKAEAIYDLVGNESSCYHIGSDSAGLVKPLLKIFKPETMADLEHICALLTASRETAETVVSRRESGFKHWSSYLTDEEFCRFIFGLEGEYEEYPRKLLWKMRHGKVESSDIEKLGSREISDDIIADICAMRYIPRRAFTADLARIVWRNSLEKQTIEDLSDFWPLSDEPDTDEREQELLDRIPATVNGLNAIQNYLSDYDGSWQARERLKEIRYELEGL